MEVIAEVEKQKYAVKLYELFNSEMHGLNHTYRFSGTQKIRNQSVSEHSYFTAIFAGALAHTENHLSIVKGVRKEKLDLSRIYEESLFHDVDEVVSGDMLHTFKHHEESKKLYTEMISAIRKIVPSQLFDNVLGGEKFKIAWDNSHEETDYHFIIKMADWLQLLQYCTEEYRLGNGFMISKINRAVLLFYDKLTNYNGDLQFVPIVIKEFLKKYCSENEIILTNSNLFG